MKRTIASIIAFMALLDGVISVAGTPCSVVGAVCGFTTSIPLTQFQISLNQPVDVGSVDATDFTVNGIPPVAVSIINGNTTLDFTYTTSPVVPGTNIMHIAAGAFNCDGGPVQEFTCRFRYIPSTSALTPSPPQTSL
jgi:hypothetical protein